MGPPKLVRADALMLPDGTPLKNVEDYRDHDVLCGQGGGTNHHVGNLHWRMLVNANKRLYLSRPKQQKALVAKSIVHAIRAQNPPGRFLARDPSSSLWCDIGDQKATEKTSQALREGAPDIRTEMSMVGKSVETRGDHGHVPGKMLSYGLTDDAMKMPSSSPAKVSSKEGLPVALPAAEASMMMAFQQYLGGKNQYDTKSRSIHGNLNSSATQPTSTSENTIPTTRKAARYLEHHEISLRNNPLIGNPTPPLGQLNSNPMSFLEWLSLPTDLEVKKNCSMLGLTPLQPGISAAAAQMKMEHMSRAELPLLDSVATQLNSFKKQKLASMHLPSPAKRGVSGSSLDDLCWAAGFHSQLGRTDSSFLQNGDNEDEKSLRVCSYRVKRKKATPKKENEKLPDNDRKTSTPKLGVNDSCLVDNESDEEVNTVQLLASKCSPDESNTSVEEHSKRSCNIGLPSYKEDVHESDVLQDDDILARGINLNRISEANLERGHSLAMSEISLDRWHSLSGLGFIGEDELPICVSKLKKVDRGCTIGTVNTFPLNI